MKITITVYSQDKIFFFDGANLAHGYFNAFCLLKFGVAVSHFFKTYGVAVEGDPLVGVARPRRTHSQ